MRVRRGIPGTDAGESEELVVVVGGQQIRELEPGTGVEVSRLPLPDQDPVDLVFAGPDLSMLYILTRNNLYTVTGITLMCCIGKTHLHQVWVSPGSPCRTLSGIQHGMIRKR